MKHPRLTRRQLFKLTALGAGSAALAPLVAAPSLQAQAHTEAPQLAIPQPTFNPIASATAFGTPADISMGWDGTLWAIDASGAPHIYDAIHDAWLPHGDGIDAAASFNGVTYFFRGDQVLQINASSGAATLTAIAATFPKVPDSFRLRVTGAVVVDQALVLVNGGRYARADGSAGPRKFSDHPLWPKTAPWQDGIVTGTYYDSTGVYLFNGAEYVNFVSLYGWSASLGQGTISGLYNWGKALPAAFASWPASWHPQLQHAPSGRDGALWCATQAGAIVMHDGEQWNVMPGGGNTAAAGQDGTVMVTSASGLYRWNGTAYDLLGNPGNLVQVSVANASTAWVRDGNNAVFRVDTTTNAFTPAPLVGSASHMAANTDDTLWHCKPGDANAYRFLAGANVQQDGIPVKQGSVTTVQKVAATGFGAAHVLVQQTGGAQVYRYDSPYVFKSQSLGAEANNSLVAQGLGQIYVSVATSPLAPPTQFAILALDAHTGTLISQTPWISEGFFSGMVFDPVHELLYVGQTWGNDTITLPGKMLALDARDLSKVAWSFATPTGVDAAPALSGTTLAFGDRTGTIYMFDTAAAYAAATANPPQAPQPKWTWKVPTYASQTHRVSTPLLMDGQVYATVWDLPAIEPGGQELFYMAWWAHCNASDGSQPSAWQFYKIGKFGNIFIRSLLSPPVPGTVYNVEPLVDSPGFFVNCGDSVQGLGSGNGSSFALPAGDQIATGFAYDAENQALWFGTNDGVLYSLNKALRPINHTPFGGGPSRSIDTTPVVYKSPNGQATILFGITDSTMPYGNLYGFDPTNGNVASVQTGVTLVTALSSSITNGMIYTAGSISPSAPPGSNFSSQAFGIRVDELPQALRDFVIESQLMQDPDQTASNGSGSADPNNPIPPSVARYQTHLTVVDDQKNPQPDETVKLWADQPNTAITVNGQKFTIGPGDAQFAAVKTGTDGSLVITADATDVNASALRAWAEFMDPYERIVVYPDHEWHARAAQSYASANEPSPDPTRPNLSTAYTYKGASLFTDDEKQQGQPTNIANAVGQMRAGVNPGGSTQAALAGALKTLRAADPGNSYIAYADLGGMHYSPSNARARRTAQVSAPIGLRLSKDASGVPGYAPLAHADARDAIDGLAGAAWDPNNPDGIASGEPIVLVVRRGDNVFTDFWNWLVDAFKKLIATIEQVVVSIADDIMVGIQFIVNGIVKVFKAIVRVVEDVVNAIGSFFLELAKVIEDVIEALSVLFHFGEIMWTHRWLAQQFQTQVTSVKTSISQQVVPAVDAFFKEGEDAIKGFFDTLRGQLQPGVQINNLKGQGATAHSTFSVPAKGGGTSPQAVQGCWGIQNVKSGLPAAIVPAQASGTNADASPISSFFTTFIARITGNGDLQSAFAQLQSDIRSLLSPSSAKGFFSSLIVTLLDILETLLIAMLAVADAFVDGFFAVIESVIDVVMDALTDPIEIPVISWLYSCCSTSSSPF